MIKCVHEWILSILSPKGPNVCSRDNLNMDRPNDEVKSEWMFLAKIRHKMEAFTPFTRIKKKNPLPCPNQKPLCYL